MLILIITVLLLDSFSLLPVELPLKLGMKPKSTISLIDKNNIEGNIFAEGNSSLNNKSVSETNFIQVCIRGSVKNPGLVKISEKGRVADAVIAAGGLKSDAYDRELNLAEVLEDGAFIYVMSKNEYKQSLSSDSNPSEKAGVGSSSANAKNSLRGGKININKATAAELDTLPGIGPATAEKIIEYRKINKKFNKIEDLSKVSGIGESKFSAIKGLISVK